MTLSNSGANNVSLTNNQALVLGASTVGSGTLFIAANGAISETGAITQAASAGAVSINQNGTSADILLDTQANNFSGGVSFGGSGTVRDLGLRNINAAASIPALPSSLRNLTLIFDNSSISIPAVSVTGDITVTAGGTISQSGLIDIGNSSTATFGVSAANSDILLSSFANDFGTGILFSNTAPAALSNIRDIAIRNTNVGAAIPSFTGITNLRNLTLVFDNASLNIPTVTLGGNLVATAGGSITQSGAITATSGSATLGVSAPNSDILLASFANNFGGSVSFSNVTPASLADIRDIAFRNTNSSASISSLSGITNLRNLTLQFDNAAIVIPAVTLTNSGNLSVTAGGAISQSGAIVVPGTSSFTAGSNGIDLSTNGSSNNFTGAVTLSNSGANDVTLTNSTALVLGASNVGQNLSLTAGGSITETGALTVTGGVTTVALTNAGSDILLGSQANDFGTSALVFSGTKSNIRDVALRNVNSGAVLPSFAGLTNLRNLTVTFNNAAIAFPAVTLTNSGNLVAVAGGAITQTGTITVPGTSSFSSGANAIDLTTNGTSNSFTGAITLSNSGANNVTLTNNNATSLAASTVGQNLTIISNGAITQTGILTVPGASSFSAGSNAINLTQSNNFTGSVLLSNNGTNNVSVTNNGALQIGTSTIGQNLALTAGGDITESGIINASNGTTTVIVTAANSNILLQTQANDFGSGSIVFGGNAGQKNNIQDVGIRNVNVAASLPSFSGLNNIRNLTIQFDNAAIVFPAITLTNSGSLSAIAGGSITQSGKLVVPGTASFNAGLNPITLITSANNFGGAVSLTNSGANDVAIRNSTDFTIGY